MDTPNRIKQLSLRLAQSNSPLEKYELMIEISHEYQRMWKLKKALEVSHQALALSQKIIHSLRVDRPRLPKDKRQHPNSGYSLKVG